MNWKLIYPSKSLLFALLTIGCYTLQLCNQNGQQLNLTFRAYRKKNSIELLLKAEQIFGNKMNSGFKGLQIIDPKSINA